MQTKKEAVKTRLMASGLEHFSADGFEKASLRKIVKSAGTTLGNFYNYYANKEALFAAIVDESYLGFKVFLQFHQEQESSGPVQVITPELIADAAGLLEAQIVALIPSLTPSFLLLIDGGKGTKYESFRSDVVDFFAGHYAEHLESQGTDDSGGYAKVAGSMFVDGMIQIVRETKETSALVGKLMGHFMFFVFGTMGVIDMRKRLADD